MRFRIRLSPQTLRVLSTFVERSSEWRYGYDLSGETSLKSGTLYPILMRLAKAGLLETRWETVEVGKPPRHMYRLTGDGLQFARQNVKTALPRLSTQPAFSGGEG